MPRSGQPSSDPLRPNFRPDELGPGPRPPRGCGRPKSRFCEQTCASVDSGRLAAAVSPTARNGCKPCRLSDPAGSQRRAICPDVAQLGPRGSRACPALGKQRSVTPDAQRPPAAMAVHAQQPRPRPTSIHLSSMYSLVSSPTAGGRVRGICPSPWLRAGVTSAGGAWGPRAGEATRRVPQRDRRDTYLRFPMPGNRFAPG